MDWFTTSNCETRTVSIRGIDLRLSISSPWEEFRAESACTKEPETLDWIDSHFAPGDLLIDVGANVGLYSLYAAQRVSSGRVVACEPAPPNLAALSENLCLNGLNRIIVCGVACDRKSGLRWLYMSSPQRGSSMHSLAAEDVEAFDVRVSHRCMISAISLDSIGKLCGWPNLIKIDVDGQEQAVLDGAHRCLSSPCARSVLVECNWTKDCTVSPVSSVLRAYGFEPTVCGAIHVRGLMNWQNVIFERRFSKE